MRLVSAVRSIDICWEPNPAGVRRKCNSRPPCTGHRPADDDPARVGQYTRHQMITSGSPPPHHRCCGEVSAGSTRIPGWQQVSVDQRWSVGVHSYPPRSAALRGVREHDRPSRASTARRLNPALSPTIQPSRRSPVAVGHEDVTTCSWSRSVPSMRNRPGYRARAYLSTMNVGARIAAPPGTVRQGLSIASALQQL